MSVIYTPEKLFTYPVPSDGISFGVINANGITTFIGIGNTIFSGSYSFDTITIALKAVAVPAPFVKPSKDDIGQITFSFRNKTWNLLDVIEGYIFQIGASKKYETWSCTGVDLNNPRVKV